MKLAKQYQQQSGKKPKAYKVIARWNAYHGSTLGALSVTDWLGVRDIPDPRAPGHSFVANPMRYRNPYGMDDDTYADHCAMHLERQIQFEGPDLVAAFIGEPIMQAHGVQVPPDRYWKKVREICDRYGVLIIIDEVITGFGRTGHWFASEHFGIEPDILTMAKAMGAGFAPIGAVMTRDEIADAIPVFRHVHTFSGHAVACAASRKVIEIKERDGLIEKARILGAQFGRDLSKALIDHPIVGRRAGPGFLARHRLHTRQRDEGGLRGRHRGGHFSPRPGARRHRWTHWDRHRDCTPAHRGQVPPGRVHPGLQTEHRRDRKGTGPPVGGATRLEI